MAEEKHSSITLKVSEAGPRDVGRGIARIDPSVMENLGVGDPGEVIGIKGKRETVAKVMPTFPEFRGKGLVQIDGISRENTQAGIDEKVTLSKVKVEEARKVTLSPLTLTAGSLADSAFLARQLSAIPVLAGDRVQATFLGARKQDFKVVNTVPSGPVLLTPETSISIVGEGKVTEARLTYEDIGGLGDQIKRIREMIELPLRFPQVFARLGIEPPKGVLLHGPPGCGKTLIAKVIANETDAYFLQLSGPQIMHKFYGESLVEDERVLVLNDGHFKRRPIAEIVANKKASLRVPCFGPDGKIRFGRVTGFHKHPFNGRLLRVRTASGRSIRVTDAHSLFTLEAEGIKSVKTSELVAGQSFVAVPRRLPFVVEPLLELDLLSLLKNDNSIVVRETYVDQLIRQAVTVLGRQRCADLLKVSPKYMSDLAYKHIGIRLPRFLRLAEAASLDIDPNRLILSTIKRRKGIPAIMTLSEDLCTFFGLWLAEGSYSHGSAVRLSVNAAEAQQVIALCTRLFGKTTIYRPRERKAVDVFICLMPLVKAMQALGFVSGARRKGVPVFIYNLSRSNLAALLRGYISGDGSVNRATPAPQVEISTVSWALADGISYLLLFFGIVAKIYDRVSESSKRICFADAENLERFLEIGFLDPGKNSVIKEYLARAPASRRDRMPLGVVQDQLGWKVNAWEGLTGIGVKAVKKRFKKLPTQLKPALEGDLFWDKVVAIEELADHPKFVYDIAVEPGENFIAGSGGIFAHNSEAHLRSVFEEAKKNAPAIFFLDELDAIAPKREELGGEKQVERRVVATLLAEMDGLEERGQVVIIGATNLPNILDPALRRPGRFDREIAIPIPDKNGRKEILAIYTRGMPLVDPVRDRPSKDGRSEAVSNGVDLERLAFLTHGFVGADLAALTREAAMYALRRLMPKIDFEQEVIPEEALLSLAVSMDDFLNALREIEPSAIREVFTEIPEVTFADVGGLDDIKMLLTRTICEPLYHPEVYAKAKTKPAKGILLTGEPGTGKTLLVKAIAKEAEVNFIAVKGPELLSKYIGESEKGVREVFKKAKQAAPCLLFFDEIEALVPKRGKLMGEQVTERVVSQFLTEMDGIEELKGVVILASTNRPDLLDPALLRPGRFDFVLELPKPDQVAREEIFRIHTKGKPLSKDVSLATLARETKGLTGADIASISQRASLLAIREFLESREKDLKKLKITKKHFMEAKKN